MIEYSFEYEQSIDVVLLGSAPTTRLTTTVKANATAIKDAENTLVENVFLLMLQRRFWMDCTVRKFRIAITDR